MFVQGNLETLGQLSMHACFLLLHAWEWRNGRGWGVSSRVHACYIQDSELQFLRGSPCSNRLFYSYIHWVDSEGLKKKKSLWSWKGTMVGEWGETRGEDKRGDLITVHYMRVWNSQTIKMPDLVVYACNSSWSLIGSYKCIQGRPGYTSSRPTWGI